MFNALKKGHIIKDPVFWKKLQLYINASLPIIPIVSSIYPPFAVIFTPAVITGAVTICGVINAYLTIATTSTIGILPSSD